MVHLTNKTTLDVDNNKYIASPLTIHETLKTLLAHAHRYKKFTQHNLTFCLKCLLTTEI